ncbi:hypothetical protein N802_16870 [Knoellia sinensis KCTC 19936]|uniref:Uncharacterized protein n=1 Tax=Knoellia sinensis KCTC 19936 TaxID=1385520 RepID=A0A0A0JAN8_9MICO|nr:hypothetical protein [Knoellia sinensis]KGN32681.1 hypothetical protein N802_16870 [Knoellia sinensis KCTC 19936]
MHPQTLTTPTSGNTCATSPARPALFPPRDADADTYRAWLARAAWPEVVFGARIPATAASR